MKICSNCGKRKSTVSVYCAHCKKTTALAPSAEEIAESCRHIQSKWTLSEECRRRGVRHDAKYEFPLYGMARSGRSIVIT